MAAGAAAVAEPLGPRVPQEPPGLLTPWTGLNGYRDTGVGGQTVSEEPYWAGKATLAM